MELIFEKKESIDTLKLLRIPFSLFLLPITLFSLYYLKPAIDIKLLLLLFIWHLLVYPSSNGYNSFHDKDTGPIGGLENPPQPGKSLFIICTVMDLSALLLSIFISPAFALFVLGYIAMSRLYSNKKIRLKKYPVVGFLTVFIYQGVWVFAGNFFAYGKEDLLLQNNIIYSMIACSGFIGCIYPLTQIYQHEADRRDNVKTISLLLGEKGTFLFSGIMFSLSAFFLYLSFSHPDDNNKNFLMFNLIMMPSLLYFLWWTRASFKDRSMINFRNTMRMLILSSILTNIYFLILLLN